MEGQECRVQVEGSRVQGAGGGFRGCRVQVQSWEERIRVCSDCRRKTDCAGEMQSVQKDAGCAGMVQGMEERYIVCRRGAGLPGSVLA